MHLQQAKVRDGCDAGSCDDWAARERSTLGWRPLAGRRYVDIVIPANGGSFIWPRQGWISRMLRRQACRKTWHTWHSAAALHSLLQWLQTDRRWIFRTKPWLNLLKRRLSRTLNWFKRPRCQAVRSRRSRFSTPTIGISSRRSWPSWPTTWTRRITGEGWATLCTRALTLRNKNHGENQGRFLVVQFGGQS